MAGNAPYPGTLIGDVIVNLGYAKRDQVEKAAGEQTPGGKRIGDILVDEGTTSRKQVEDAFNVQKELRTRVDGLVAAGEKPDLAKVTELTLGIAKEHNIPVEAAVKTEKQSQVDFSQPLTEKPVKTTVSQVDFTDKMLKASLSADAPKTQPVEKLHQG